MSKFYAFILFIVLPTMLYAQQKGEYILKLDFDSESSINMFEDSENFEMTYKDDRHVLKISTRNSLCTLNIPVEKVRGAKLLVSTTVKAKNVSKQNSWNGVKIMLQIKQPGDNIYAQTPLPDGSFDWQRNEFNTLVPVNADTVSLVLGLEKAKGKAWFDDVSIKVLEPSRLNQKDEISNVVNSASFPRLRGMMVPTFIPDTSVERLAIWGVRHIRWQLTWGGFPASYADTASLDDYKQWLNKALNYLDSTLLPVCKKYNISVVVDLHTLPGGCLNGGYEHRIFKDAKWQKAFIEIWKGIATRYKTEKIILGYDLANEPIEGDATEGVANWHDLAMLTAKSIRDIDTLHFIIVEAAPGGTDYALAAFRPFFLSKIVYSFHMYLPAFFTHQGLGGRPSNVRYPGIVERREWNKHTMRSALNEIKEWQRMYGVDIYVGEFSAIRWAPGESAYYYLKDCIELFEEYGWSWVYHAFREYDGWSVEHNNNPDDHSPVQNPTSRQQLLMYWYNR